MPWFLDAPAKSGPQNRRDGEDARLPRTTLPMCSSSHMKQLGSDLRRCVYTTQKAVRPQKQQGEVSELKPVGRIRLRGRVLIV